MGLLKLVERKFSRLDKIPGLSLVSPSVSHVTDEISIKGFKATQELAFRAANEVQSYLRPGWSERQAAKFFEEVLRDFGVKSFFHRPFVWFGENTRFRNVRRYKDFLPSERRVLENEVVILDVAPIYEGHTADIGHSFCLGEMKDYFEAREFLKKLRETIPLYFSQFKSGEDIWNQIDRDIHQSGYDNIHKLYPFSVLGHRLHESSEKLGEIQVLNFEWNSYWNLLSRGVFGQILSPHYQGELVGLWAIEPHIGFKEFGIKFEEILIVHRSGAHWLRDTI